MCRYIMMLTVVTTTMCNVNSHRQVGLLWAGDTFCGHRPVNDTFKRQGAEDVSHIASTEGFSRSALITKCPRLSGFIYMLSGGQHGQCSHGCSLLSFLQTTNVFRYLDNNKR